MVHNGTFLRSSIYNIFTKIINEIGVCGVQFVVFLLAVIGVGNLRLCGAVAQFGRAGALKTLCRRFKSDRLHAA